MSWKKCLYEVSEKWLCICWYFWFGFTEDVNVCLRVVLRGSTMYLEFCTFNILIIHFFLYTYATCRILSSSPAYSLPLKCRCMCCLSCVLSYTGGCIYRMECSFDLDLLYWAYMPISLIWYGNLYCWMAYFMNLWYFSHSYRSFQN